MGKLKSHLEDFHVQGNLVHDAKLKFVGSLRSV